MNSAVTIAGMTMIISHTVVLAAGLIIGLIIAFVDSRIDRPGH